MRRGGNRLAVIGLGLGLALSACNASTRQAPAPAPATRILPRTPGDGGAPAALPLPKDLLPRLLGVPGLTAAEAHTPVRGYRFYIMQLAQPVDHEHPNAGQFQLRVTLLYRDPAAPVVLYSSGYDVSLKGRRIELARLLEANQVSIEHRFFGTSQPQPLDFTKLTVAQAAADHHGVVQALRPLMPGPWLSAGGSKGGLAAVLHRRFYPDDVTATVAYVAPLSLGAPDDRYAAFLTTIGDDAACRASLLELQRVALIQRAALLARLDGYARDQHLSFTRLGPDMALEHAVLELPFDFWQFGGADSSCAAVPGPSASADRIFQYLADVADFHNVSDAGIAARAPYFYQAQAQLGYPRYGEQGLQDLLRHPGTDLPATYLPAGTHPQFDPQAMADLNAWVQAEGERLLFLYGSTDPWSASEFQLGRAVDSYVFTVDEGNHDSLLNQLDDADRQRVAAILGRWVGGPPPQLEAAQSPTIHAGVPVSDELPLLEADDENSAQE
jgi:hypothetical protein